MSKARPTPAPYSPPAAGLPEAEEVAPFGVWEWDITRNTMRWSDGLHRIYGLQRGEFPATYEGHIARVHPDDRTRVHNAVQQAYRQRAPFEIEERLVRPTGEVRWLISYGQVACDARGQPIRMTGVCHDITPFKRAQAELAERVHVLERGHEDVEEFSHTAVRNLQEPLRIVEGYLRQLAQPGANVAEWSRITLNNVLYMQQFVAALLAYSRVGQSFQPAEGVELGAALGDACASLADRIREAGAVVTHDALPSATADRVQLAELFERLIENALRYRGEAPPRIHVSAARAEGHWVVSLRDNGCGIEPGQLERVFTLSARRAPAAGTPRPGIGLAICRRIVARHSGRIWAASDGPGKGATFTFTLPDLPPA